MGELRLGKMKFREICENYSETIVDETDMCNAFCIVHDLLMAEADAIDGKYNHTSMGARLRLAAYEVLSIAPDMEEAYEEVVTE